MKVNRFGMPQPIFVAAITNYVDSVLHRLSVNGNTTRESCLSILEACEELDTILNRTFTNPDQEIQRLYERIKSHRTWANSYLK